MILHQQNHRRRCGMMQIHQILQEPYSQYYEVVIPGLLIVMLTVTSGSNCAVPKCIGTPIHKKKTARMKLGHLKVKRVRAPRHEYGKKMHMSPHIAIPIGTLCDRMAPYVRYGVAETDMLKLYCAVVCCAVVY